MNECQTKNDVPAAPAAASTEQRVALAAVAGGLATTLLTTIACVGPLVAILLGIGGFGWLTQYAYLRAPATIATVACVGLGFYFVYVRPRRACARQRASGLTRFALWAATLLAVAVNVFEYIIFPRLG